MPYILIIEADRQLAGYTTGYLKKTGSSVEVHSNLQKAVKAADSQRPDVVVLGLQLAGRSGIEFLYELRSYPDWQKLPVIVTGQLSADELAAYKPALQQLEAIYLDRPSTSLQLMANRVAELLQLARV